MTTCDRISPLLPLHAGGDLETDLAATVEAHASLCGRCRETLLGYRQVIDMASLCSDEELRLPDGARRRVAQIAAERAARRSSGLAGWLLPFPVRQAAALAAGALVVTVGLSALLKIGSGSHPAEISNLEVVAADGTVRLAWDNGAQGTYTVYKSSDPRSLTAAEAHTVRGTVWTDTEPDTATVVFYRIE